jgi:hypothetical protein
MYNRWKAWSVFFVMTWLLALKTHVGLCQTQQQLWEEVKQTWIAYKAEMETIRSLNFLDAYEAFAKSGDIQLYADSIRELAIDGIRPENNRDIRERSAAFLAFSHTQANEDTLRAHLHDPQFSVAHIAATTLLSWGFWDEAAPVLAEQGAYYDLGGDWRAVPYLLEGVKSSDPARRWVAAYWLAHPFHDTTYIHQAAMDVFSLPDDDQYLATKSNAAEYLSKTGHGMDPSTASASDLDFLASVAIADTDELVSLNIVRDLLSVARSGNVTAVPLLEQIATNAASMYIREEAQRLIQLLPK